MRYLSLILILLLLPLQLAANSAYPKPKPSHERLFYLQRSTNANTVVYDARLTETGRLDPEQPVEVYWRRFNNGGERKGLNFLERHFAYGVDVDKEQGDKYMFKLVSLPEREGELRLSDKGKPEVVTEISGDSARLLFIYVKVDDQTGLWPSVDYIELFGESLADGREVTERIIP